MAEDQEPGLRAALASHCGPMEVDDLPLHPRFATTKVTRPGLVKGSHQPRPFWWQPPNLQRLSTPLIGLDSAYSQARLSWRLRAYRAEPGHRRDT